MKLISISMLTLGSIQPSRSISSGLRNSRKLQLSVPGYEGNSGTCIDGSGIQFDRVNTLTLAAQVCIDLCTPPSTGSYTGYVGFELSAAGFCNCLFVDGVLDDGVLPSYLDQRISIQDGVDIGFISIESNNNGVGPIEGTVTDWAAIDCYAYKELVGIESSPTHSPTKVPSLAPSTSKPNGTPSVAPPLASFPSVDNHGEALGGRCVDSTNQEYDLFFWDMNEFYGENFDSDNLDLVVELCAAECGVFATDKYVGFGVRLNYGSDNLAGRCACMWENGSLGALDDIELHIDILWYFFGHESFQLDRSGSGPVSGGSTEGPENQNWTCYPYIGNQ